MPDIGELLASAVRDDDGSPDLVWVEKRAVTLQRRQRIARSTAAAGVVLVAAVIFRTAGAGKDALELVPASPAPRSTATSTPLPAPAPGGTAPLAGRPGGPPASGGAVPAVPASPAEGTSRPDPGAQDRPSPDASPAPQYPSRRSCSVSTKALGPEQTATCRFTATEPGGYEIFGGSFVLPKDDPVAYVEVVHQGRTTRYEVWKAPDPCRSNVIAVGDLVTVTAGQARAGSYFDYQLAAGGGYSCEGR
jgi:hypothetical protein